MVATAGFVPKMPGETIMTIKIGHIPQSESTAGPEEWTVESAVKIYSESGIGGLVVIHNAGIAAEQKKTQNVSEQLDAVLLELKGLERELAKMGK